MNSTGKSESELANNETYKTILEAEQALQKAINEMTAREEKAAVDAYGQELARKGRSANELAQLAGFDSY